MTKIKLGIILEDAARLAGRDSTFNPIPLGWKVLAAMTLNAGIRDLAAEKFPMMQRVEFRRYRPNWTRGIKYLEGHEVWFKEDYYRALKETIESPDEGSDWLKLKDGEVNSFIEYQQPWEDTIMDPGGVDYTAFAYTVDPRYNPAATPISGCSMSSLGILLPAGSPKGVYVRFVPYFAAITFNDYVDGNHYSAGDVVYVEAEKEVYQALKDTGDKPAESVDWQKLRVRREFQVYLTRLLAADFMTEDQGKYQTRAAAASELETLHERYIHGVGSRRAKVGRFV